MGNQISYILKSRPVQNESIEQFLMDESSINYQINNLRDVFCNKKNLFLGDDDHVSIVNSFKFKNNYSYVLELDDRVIDNQKRLSQELNIKNHVINKYDIRDKITDNIDKCDVFYINPPYSSKNQGYGVICWISRALEILKNEGVGIVVIPTISEIDWVINNLKFIENFILKNNCVIYNIDYNVHNYMNKHSNYVKSSNIYIKYLGNAQNLLTKIEPSIYR